MNVQLSYACVSDKASLLEGMQSLSKSCMRICLIIDNNKKLTGILTDGDIRRALLNGASLNSGLLPYIQRSFLAVSKDVSRSEVLDLMKARFIEQVPVLSESGEVLGVHLLRQMLGAHDKPNAAVIMAGGRGERLKPLTDTIPKPMVRVAGRPILERIILHLVGYGIRKIFISVNYLASMIEDYFGNGQNYGCHIEYLREESPLGTGGPLSLLPRGMKMPTLVLNGDLITQANLDAMLNLHSIEKNMITVGTREFTHQVPFGCLEVEYGEVKAIVEKPIMSRTINAGIYAFSPDVLDAIPPQSSFPITALIEKSIFDGHRVGAFPVDEDWIDVGRPEELSKARGN